MTRSDADVAAERITATQARRIALAAQGFADPRPAGRVNARHVRKVVQRLGILQIDSVNVLCRSHYLPVFARLGPYPRDVLDTMSAYTARPVRPDRRELVEYWAHEASLVPSAMQPLLRWRMQRASADAWPGVRRIAHERPALLDDLVAMIDASGPIRGSDTGIERRAREPGAMWDWHDGKIALEYLFYAGRVTTARRVNFERHYDRPERVLPPAVLAAATPDPADAQRELVRIAARAHGVATEPDLRDYFRLSHRASKQAVAELVAAGELAPVVVAGWGAPAYLWHTARRPRRVAARALLSPFDSLVWFRDRTERVFGMRYRIEIYTPAPQRVFGYYVLPFLLGEDLVARVDLKADRQAGVLRVQAAHLEPGRDADVVAPELAAELRLLAAWLDLGDILVAGPGDLSAPLLAALLEASA